MSSAATAPAMSRAGGAAATVAWTVLAAVVALGAAGLSGELLHAPGGPTRAELTWTDDQALSARLDTAAATLTDISANVDKMAEAAKAALGSVASVDPDNLKQNIERGNGAAVLIAQSAANLRTSLTGLPGDGPEANVDYSNAVLVRRAAILAAMDAALSLAEDWDSVTSRSENAARAASLLNQHEATAADATTLGRESRYADAIAKIQEAEVTLEDIQSLRDLIVEGGDVTILDEWIDRHQTFDTALENLYKALQAAGGRNTLVVQDAYRQEQAAEGNLPTNNGAIVVIVAQIAQGGLNQAVIAINDAQGRIDSALAPASPPP